MSSSKYKIQNVDLVIQQISIVLVQFQRTPFWRQSAKIWPLPILLLAERVSSILLTSVSQEYTFRFLSHPLDIGPFCTVPVTICLGGKDVNVIPIHWLEKIYSLLLDWSLNKASHCYDINCIQFRQVGRPSSFSENY